MPPVFNQQKDFSSVVVSEKKLIDGRIIWYIFIFFLFCFIAYQFKNQANSNLFPISGITLAGLFYILFLYKFFLKDFSLFNLIFSIVFSIGVVIVTGGLGSPFYFMLVLLPIISVDFSIPATIIALIEMVIFLGGLSVITHSFSFIYENPFQNACLIISPLFSGAVGQLYSSTLFKLDHSFGNINDKQRTNIQNLQQLNQEFEAILQAINEGIIITDLKGKITYANKKILEILNASSKELVGYDIGIILSFQDIGGKILKNWKVKSVLASGRELYLVVDTFPLLFDSKMQGSIYLIKDVTSNMELEKQKLDFIALAAHQLRTPLTILKSYLSVLSDSISGKLSPDEQKNLERAVVGANQLSALIENLLSISHIEDHQLKPSLIPNSIETVLNSALSQLTNQVSQKNIKIHINKPSNQLPPVVMDSAMIQQVLVNLLTNAINFSSTNGEITIGFQIANNSLVLSITDHGPGIPSEATTHLFNKFFKVAGNLVQETKGLGIGLYTAKAMIDANHGNIWVDSLMGKGSTFSISLPIATQTFQTAAPPPPANPLEAQVVNSYLMPH